MHLIGKHVSRRKAKLVVASAAIVVLATVLSVVTALAWGSGAELSRKAFSGCPAARSAPLGDTSGVESAARAFGLQQQPRRFVVGLLSLSPFSLGTDDVWRNIARKKCGSLVESRSWAAFYFTRAGAKSPDLSEGVVYFAQTARGWKAWYVYR